MEQFKSYHNKPDLEFLTKSYFCADMHFHTLASDGAAKINDILKKIERLGISVAITDHNTISGVVKAKKTDRDANIIPGIEVKFSGNIDILFYFYELTALEDFYNKYVRPNLSRHPTHPRLKKNMMEVFDIAKNYKCITSFAHPYKYKNIDKFNKIAENVDAIEVINPGMNRQANIFASQKSEEYKKGATAGSDGHSIYELGNTITYSKANNTAGFLDNIRQRRSYTVGEELRFLKNEKYYYYIKNHLENLVKWN